MPGTIKRGSNWTGNYSRFSYDESKRQVVMLKELGKPVLDDEFNFLQDALLTMTRKGFRDAFGGASPNNGFQVVGTGANNDFTIKGGDGTVDNAGVFYVGGLRMILPSDVAYSTQEVPGAALTAPTTGTRLDTVYLDVYLDEQSPSDDPTMVDPTLNIETSRRARMFYSVQVAQGASPPSLEYIDANGRLHVTAVLATLNRTTSPAITPDLITDMRGKFRVSDAVAGGVAAHNTDLFAHYGATTGQRGFIVLATPTEAIAGSDNAKAITPFTLQAALGPIAGSGVPTGFEGFFLGASPPAGWLVADGSAVSRASYPILFAMVGTTYGPGDGTTTFNLPDNRGRSLLGSGTGSGLSSRPLGTQGGEEAHVLSQAELPNVSLGNGVVDDTGIAFNYGKITTDIPGAATTTMAIDTGGQPLTYQGLTGPLGSGAAHNTMHPYSAALPIIKY